MFFDKVLSTQKIPIYKIEEETWEAACQIYSLPLTKGGLVGMSISLRMKGLDRRAGARWSGDSFESIISFYPRNPITNNPYLHSRRTSRRLRFFCRQGGSLLTQGHKKKTNNNFVVTRLENFVPHPARLSNFYRWLLENSRVYRVVKRFLSRKSSVSYKKVLTSYPYYLIMLVGIPLTAPMVSAWFMNNCNNN